jgi:hypothetical protein
MRRRAAFLGVFWMLLAVALAAEGIRVGSLVRGGQVLVSFSIDGRMPDELTESIRSGLLTTIAYDVELRRAVPVWWDNTVASVTVSVTAKYDNLTRIYQLSRTSDGRGEAARTTDDPEVVRKWMTEFDRLGLFPVSALEPNGEYYVRVRARSQPRFGWFAWPWDRGWATGFTKFTFIS